MTLDIERIVRDTKDRSLGAKNYTAQDDGPFVSDGTKNLIQHVWSTFVESASEEGFGTQVVGFVHYSDDGSSASNKVLRLDFYKPTNFTITSVLLQTRYFDAFQAGGATARLVDIDILLNPTKATITTGAFDYYRFSAGTAIRNGYDPTADEDTTEDDFSSVQIDAISDGWNKIVVQQETNDTGGTQFGFAAVNLVMNGYVE